MTRDAATRGRDEVPDAQVDPLLGAGGRCIVGFDGSAASRAALAWAALRCLPRFQLHLVAVDDAAAPSGESAVGSRRIARALSEAADELLLAYPGARITTRVDRGQVVAALTRATGPDDLLVIGSDKTGYMRGRTFGVRALQLAAALHGALVVVPSVDLRLRTGVVVAVGHVQSGPALALRGAQEAVRRGCSLTIVHAMGPDGGTHRATPGDRLLAAARDAVLAAHPGLEVRTLATARRAADAILNVSRGAALLLLGRSRPTTALGVGETIHDVLMNANAPTVILR